MKKCCSLVLSLVLLLSMLLPAFEVCYAETFLTTSEIGQEQKKVINVVYDDSGSMVNGSEQDVTKADAYVTTWAQAKYSLEAFVAVMNDGDEMNIFCMSDAGDVTMTVKGSDRADGVEDIHSNFKTGDYSVLTPVTTMENAYKSLSDDKYDDYEKWLVVLTDGAFTVSNKSNDKVSNSEIKSKLSSYGSSLDGNLIYIPIGSDAEAYSANSYKTLKASSGEELLSQVKAASEYIYYERDKEEISETSINLGVSMKKIIVFAQGAGVEIEGTSKGKITNNISVKYTEAENAVEYNTSKTTFKNNSQNIKTDTSLQGVVVTIEPNGDCIEPGQLNITFGDSTPQSYTIYYEPAVKAYYSLEKDGVEYLSSENETSGGSLNPGTYTLTAYVADAYQENEDSTPVDVSDASEIQDIKFEVTLSGDGVSSGEQSFALEQLRNGAQVTLGRGDVECLTYASILSDKYSVDTSAMDNSFSSIVVKDTYRLEITYEKPTPKTLSYAFKKTNFLLHSLDDISDEEDMIKAVVTCYDGDGNKVDITDEQWQQVTAQTIKLYSDDTYVQYDTNAFNFHTEDGTGVFYLCPRYWTENDEANKKKTTHTNYIHRNRLCSVRSEIYIDVSDDLAYSTLGSTAEQKSATYEISLCMWHTIITLIIIIWCLGYVFKKKLPRVKMAEAVNEAYFRYTIDTADGEYKWMPQVKGKEDMWIEIHVNPITRLLPYVSQKGEIDLGIPLIPTLKIKALNMFQKRYKVRLLNSARDFESVNGIKSYGSKNSYLELGGKGSVTKKNIEEKKNFDFSLSELRYGGILSRNKFAKYKLSFKKQRKE